MDDAMIEPASPSSDDKSDTARGPDLDFGYRSQDDEREGIPAAGCGAGAGAGVLDKRVRRVHDER